MTLRMVIYYLLKEVQSKMGSIKYERTEYPRPQFERESWMNLNGQWDFAFDNANEGEGKSWYKAPDFDQHIQVPFTYETRASGINDHTFHPNIWYHRTFKLPTHEQDKRV